MLYGSRSLVKGMRTTSNPTAVYKAKTLTNWREQKVRLEAMIAQAFAADWQVMNNILIKILAVVALAVTIYFMIDAWQASVNVYASSCETASGTAWPLFSI